MDPVTFQLQMLRACHHYSVHRDGLLVSGMDLNLCRQLRDKGGVVRNDCSVRVLDSAEITRSSVISGNFNHIAVVLWSIWKERNRFIFSHQNPRPQATILNDKPNSKKSTEHLSESWRPPPPGSVRINIDASFAPDLDNNAAPSDATEPPRHRAAIACVC